MLLLLLSAVAPSTHVHCVPPDDNQHPVCKDTLHILQAVVLNAFADASISYAACRKENRSVAAAGSAAVAGSKHSSCCWCCSTAGLPLLGDCSFVLAAQLFCCSCFAAAGVTAVTSALLFPYHDAAAAAFNNLLLLLASSPLHKGRLCLS